jgi:hypothetical protein
MNTMTIGFAFLAIGFVAGHTGYQLLLRKMNRLNISALPDNSPAMGFFTNFNNYRKECLNRGISVGWTYYTIVIGIVFTLLGVLMLISNQLL